MFFSVMISSARVSEQVTIERCFLGCVRLTVIRKRNTWNISYKPFVFTEIHIKDGAYYCYCAYVLRISRYSDFLSVMLTNAGIFLRGLKLCRESRT